MDFITITFESGKLRTREYLTEAEVERLMNTAKGNRWGHRDATMVFGCL
jgi:type 1 fimbriae regulatory protein FimB/type 1 fimbriae regulatory protein FimE